MYGQWSCINVDMFSLAYRKNRIKIKFDFQWLFSGPSSNVFGLTKKSGQLCFLRQAILKIMCIYTYIYIYIVKNYTCVYVYIYIYVYMYIYIFTCIHIYDIQYI